MSGLEEFFLQCKCRTLSQPPVLIPSPFPIPPGVDESRRQLSKGKYPPKVELQGMSVEDLNLMLPCVGHIGYDDKDSALRLTFRGKQHTRSLSEWGGVEGAGEELLKLAWKYALKQGFEKACPFDEFGLNIAEETAA